MTTHTRRLTSRSGPIAVLALSCALTGSLAQAHEASLIYAQVTRAPDGTVTEALTLTPSTLALLAPVDANDDGELTDAELQANHAAIIAGVWEQLPLRAGDGPCTRREAKSRLVENHAELGATFLCGPGELTQTFQILSILPSSYRVVLVSYKDGTLASQLFAQGGEQTLTMLGEGGATSAARGVGSWIVIGVEHIFKGIDHIAFLLAVLLIGGTWKRVLLLVTSFTIAHSITLAIVALGLVTLSDELGRWVEILIAASICWVVVENVVLKDHRHRVFLTFGFGLIHGFGFASVLMELGLGRSVASGLLGFNLGVELGQALIVALFFPVIRYVSKRPTVNLWTLRVGSGAIFFAGLLWLIERVRG